MKMAKTVLYRGSFILMFTAPHDFGRYFNALIRHDFDRQPYPFLFLRDEEYIQSNRRMKSQNLAEFIVLSCYHGFNRNNFKAKKSKRILLTSQRFAGGVQS